jgi:hypothetical protein
LINNRRHDRIQSGCRLVAEKQLRIEREGTRQANALFHSAADFSWFKIFKPGQPDHLKFSFHNLFDFIRGLVSVLKKGQRNIFADGERGEQRAGLE